MPTHSPAAPDFSQRARDAIQKSVYVAYEDIRERYRAMSSTAKYRAQQRTLDYLYGELPTRMRTHRAYPSSDLAVTPPDTYLVEDYGKQGLTVSQYRVLPTGFCAYYHIRRESSGAMAMEYLPIMLAHTFMELGVPVQLVEHPEVPARKKDGVVVDIGIRQAIAVIVDLRDLERIGLA